MDWYHRILPTSADESHQSAAERDCDPPLVPTLWSAPLPRTLALVHRRVGPKGLESAAGALTGTRKSRLFQDGIEDLSSLHPVVAANCLDTTRPCNDFHVTACYKLSALLLLLS